jgi:hypothetical protein
MNAEEPKTDPILYRFTAAFYAMRKAEMACQIAPKDEALREALKAAKREYRAAKKACDQAEAAAK